MFKKIIAVVTALVLCLSLVACGGSKKETSKDKDETSSKKPSKKEISISEKLEVIEYGGGAIYYGSYEQDADKDNGKEDIEWVPVMALQGPDGGKAGVVLLSKYILDVQPYNDPNTNTTYADWSKSYLAAWIEQEFVKESFTEEELEHIGTVTNDGVTTHACLFNETQHSRYMDKELYVAEPTEYAKLMATIYENDVDASSWWMASEQSVINDYVMTKKWIEADGMVSIDTPYTRPAKTYTYRGFRPVIIVMLETEQKADKETSSKEEEPTDPTVPRYGTDGVTGSWVFDYATKLGTDEKVQLTGSYIFSIKMEENGTCRFTSGISEYSDGNWKFTGQVDDTDEYEITFTDGSKLYLYLDGDGHVSWDSSSVTMYYRHMW